MNKYTDRQIDVMLNMYFRDHLRPAPWPAIAAAMGVVCNIDALERFKWGVISGYGGNIATGPRREYTATPLREGRAGLPWQAREIDALRLALEGEGRLRTPPCDIPYIAAVLARPVAEVAEMWKELNADPIGRKGFGLGA